MKIILILSILLPVNSAWSLEWDQKAFKESMNSYKNKAQGWIASPKTVVEDFKNKYGDSYHIVKEQVTQQLKEVGNTDYTKDWNNLVTYYDVIQGKWKTYSSFQDGRQLMDLLSRDISNTFEFAYNNIERVPVIGPYKREIVQKVQYIQTTVIPYRAVFNSALNHGLAP